MWFNCNYANALILMAESLLDNYGPLPHLDDATQDAINARNLWADILEEEPAIVNGSPHNDTMDLLARIHPTHERFDLAILRLEDEVRRVSGGRPR